jgi:hypothetical protein
MTLCKSLRSLGIDSASFSFSSGPEPMVWQVWAPKRLILGAMFGRWLGWSFEKRKEGGTLGTWIEVHVTSA